MSKSKVLNPAHIPATDPTAKCPICGRNPASPYRKYVMTYCNGVEGSTIAEGCIAGFHTGHIRRHSLSYLWHMRIAAQKMRQQQKFL